MPNRILREGYLDSEKLRLAGELAEVLFVRLMLVCDDFGRFDGRVSVICRRCWPICGPTDEDVLTRLVALTGNGLVVTYEVDGKPFIYIPNFKQRTRSPGSKFPNPPTGSQSNDGPTAVMPPSTDGQVSAVGARSSYFEVRSSSFDIRGSDGGHPPAEGKSNSKPRAAAQSIAKVEENKRVLAEAAEKAAPMPEDLLKFVRPH